MWFRHPIDLVSVRHQNERGIVSVHCWEDYGLWFLKWGYFTVSPLNNVFTCLILPCHSRLYGRPMSGFENRFKVYHRVYFTSCDLVPLSCSFKYFSHSLLSSWKEMNCIGWKCELKCRQNIEGALQNKCHLVVKPLEMQLNLDGCDSPDRIKSHNSGCGCIDMTNCKINGTV